MMTNTQINQIQNTITELYNDSKNDFLKVIPGVAKSVFRPMQPSDFRNAYLAISEEQGKVLTDIIKEHKYKNIVEFGTSFGISTLFLAQGVLETGGRIITTELIPSKAEKAKENFENAGVSDLIEVRIGDAMKTLKDHNEPVDLLLLDGWKDLYLDVFQLLEPNFHANTIIYVDNADMSDTKVFLQTITQNETYRSQEIHHGKAVLITTKNR
ncbi:MAG: class I SAM-dependent methyltransferase [Imperialibacter sp.]|uniref:O-methyltransferase n=1 Tax=Imperialibacter sp. TaxID=2038411 RepID=UPI0032EBE29F